mmetsp:Transcript_23818/g.38638  ORF Transcript_23818/g.38638 Transcript_23818/m.38638 type:complete len:201 (+) Transcript_23818:1275-1877(+)
MQHVHFGQHVSGIQSTGDGHQLSFDTVTGRPRGRSLLVRTDGSPIRVRILAVFLILTTDGERPIEPPGALAPFGRTELVQSGDARNSLLLIPLRIIANLNRIDFVIVQLPHGQSTPRRAKQSRGTITIRRRDARRRRPGMRRVQQTAIGNLQHLERLVPNLIVIALRARSGGKFTVVIVIVRRHHQVALGIALAMRDECG